MHEHVAQLRQGNLKPDRSICSLVDEFSARGLAWWPQIGVGHYPVTAGLVPYDQDYFDAFARNAETELGRALMLSRFNFVEQHYRGTLVDVGIGCGAFVELRNGRGRTTYGYDVNPAGVEWLDNRKLFVDPNAVISDAVTLWDVLEHIPDFKPLLENVRQWVFVSLPIFYSVDHVLASKHFKPDEHCWYFTRDGLVIAMQSCGFSLVSENRVETDLGREDIGTFAFKR